MANGIVDAEEWRTVPGFPSYEVSDRGRVRRPAGLDSIGRPRLARILRPNLSRGYRHVSLCENARARTVRVHTIVALAFVGPRPLGTVVNHKDGVKANNTPSNLEYVTPVANDLHASRMGLKAAGDRHGMAKLTANAVAQIRQHGVQRTATNSALAERYGVHVTTIERILGGQLWKTA